MVVSSPGVRQLVVPAASYVTEQIPHCSPTPGGNLEKVVLNKACLSLTRVGLLRPIRAFLPAVEKV